MLYQKATLENGQMKITESKVIDQSKLPSECWKIQFNGLKECETCQYKNKPRLCGGMAIRKRLEAQPKSVRFKWLTGDMTWMEYGGKWISNKLNNGEYDYWLVLELTNLLDSCGEKEAKEMGGKYMVNLNAVSPSQVSEEDLKNALQSWGMEDKPLSKLSDEMKVEVLDSYGTRANIWYGTGNNALKLLKEGRQHAREEGKDSIDRSLNSFANALGHTKADFLRGDLSFDTAIKNRKAAGLPY